MRNKGVWTFLLGMVLLLTACSSSTPSDQADREQPEPNDHPNRASVKIYYTNEQATEMLAETRTIEYEESSAKYAKTLDLLTEPEKDDHYALWPQLEYHSVTLDQGTVTVDLHGDQSFNMGSGVEMLAVQSLISTLFYFEDVQSVQLLVDGEKETSLAGHVNISEPFERSDMNKKTSPEEPEE